MTLKTIILTLALGTYALASAAPDFRLVVTPGLNAVELTDMRLRLETYICKEADVGTRISVYDGVSGILISQYALAAMSHDTPRSRKLTLRDFHRDLIMWAKKTPDYGGKKPLHIPEIIADISRGASDTTKIVFWGDPVYSNARAPEFNFFDGNRYSVPERSVFGQTPDNHPFGCIERPALSAQGIYIVNVGKNDLDPRYSIQLEDFYDDYFRALQANGLERLATKSQTVLTEIFNAPVERRERIASIDQEILDTEKPEPIALTPPQPAIQPDIPEQIEAFEERSVAQFTRESQSSEFSIGIAWDFAADLDLHWFFSSGTSSVSYHRNTHGNARYLGDKTSGGSGWETIVFTQAPDNLDEFWVNIYRISPQRDRRLTGLLMIKHNGQVTERRFTVPSGSGNNAGDKDARDRSDNWVKLSVNSRLASVF